MNEIWKTIPRYGGCYAISNFGRIKRILPGGGAVVGRILKNATNTYGYRFVNIHYKGKAYPRTVHSLLIDTFYPGQRAGKQINHEDGNKSNNRIDNLKIMTRRENIEHAKRNGLTPKPYKRKYGAAQLNKDEVREIKKSLAGGEAQQSIADRFGVTRYTIYAIHSGRTWKHVA